MTIAYPLQWPVGKPRKKYPEKARFDISQERAQLGVKDQIRMLGGTLPVISTNVELRRDGLPYAGRRDPEDKGVAVYFTLRGQQMCFACDRWDKIKDNMQAINKTIEALRGIERWGSGDMVQQAFKGFLALPAPAQRSCWQVLGIPPDSNSKDALIAYRTLAKNFHPDAGGSPNQFAELYHAYQECLEKIREREERSHA